MYLTMVVVNPLTAAVAGLTINYSGGAYQNGMPYGIMKKIELVD